RRALQSGSRPRPARGADREDAMSAAEAIQSGPAVPIIRVEGITKEYQVGSEQVRALRGVDLTIERNECVSVMGQSGPGKSTLLNVIGCLAVPTAGRYWLNGQEVETPGEDARARI